MVYSDITVEFKELGKLFKNIGIASGKAGKKKATNVMKFPVGASEFGAKFGSPAKGKNVQLVSSTFPHLLKIYLTRS